MSNAQWFIVISAGVIALILLSAQGGTSPFLLRFKAVLKDMFSGPSAIVATTNA